jgi:hypothetical protein
MAGYYLNYPKDQLGLSALKFPIDQIEAIGITNQQCIEEQQASESYVERSSLNSESN